MTPKAHNKLCKIPVEVTSGATETESPCAYEINGSMAEATEYADRSNDATSAAI